MPFTNKLFVLIFMAAGGLILTGRVQAAATTLDLNAVSGDNVRITVNGEVGSPIQLSFWPAGAAAITTITIGSTNASGQFITSLSSGGYGIPAGSPTYASINGSQSGVQLWPNYTSSVVLSQNNLQIAVGQSVTVGSSQAIILAANSFASGLAAAVSGSQLTVTGLASGSGALSICGVNVGCAPLAVMVGSGGQTQVSFNLNNFTLINGSSKNINIFGNSRNGYFIKTHSNPDIVDANISGASDILSLFAKPTKVGAATVTVCSSEDSANCAALNLTVLGQSYTQLSFSQNNLQLIPGLSQNVTVTGGPSSSYYLAANTDSGMATANLSGATLTVTGGSNTGSAIIKVCSTTVNDTCGQLNVYNNADTQKASPNTLAFSQNVVVVAKDASTNVTVSGGSGGYVVSGNTNPIIAAAQINGASDIINIQGQQIGSTTINICSTTGNACAGIYVNVTDQITPITFSQSAITIAADNKSILSIFGETGAKKITANDNPSLVTPSLNNDGNILLLAAGSRAGSAVIKICSETHDTNCAAVKITVTAPAGATATTEPVAANQAVAGVKTAAADDQLRQIADEVATLMANAAAESASAAAYLAKLPDSAALNANARRFLGFFIVNGTDTTKILGAGERAGAVSSFAKAFGKLPTAAEDWTDILKIANGRWPGAVSQTALTSAQSEFVKVYQRAAVISEPPDNAAVSIIAYGLRPTARNLNSEKAAIKTFRAVYGHDPASALAWDIVRAIAYSGAKR